MSMLDSGTVEISSTLEGIFYEVLLYFMHTETRIDDDVDEQTAGDLSKDTTVSNCTLLDMSG